MYTLDVFQLLVGFETENMLPISASSTAIVTF